MKVYLLLLLLLLAPLVAAQEVIIDIPKTYTLVSPGEELVASISLLNPGGRERMDVYLDLWVTDAIGGTIYSKKETVAVETQANFVKTIDLPTDLPTGGYALNVKMTTFAGKEITSSRSFGVQQSAKRSVISLLMYLSLILLLLGLLYKRTLPIIEKWKVKIAIKKIMKKRKHLGRTGSF